MSLQRCNSIGSGFEFLALRNLGSKNLGKLSNSFMSCLCFHICRTGIIIQLTLEQYEFELRGSTYMHIFFNSKYNGTTGSETGWIWRNLGTIYIYICLTESEGQSS